MDVGVRHDETREHAIEDGFLPLEIPNVVRKDSILMLLLPDEIMPEVYLEKIAPHLKRGDVLIFASGYNIAYGFIEPPPFIDVGVIAPRTFGVAVRERYLNGQGFFFVC